jgi:F-type H+-transporting ATPase subunit b
MAARAEEIAVRRLRFVTMACALGAAWALQERTALAAEGEGGPYFGDIGVTVATVAIFLLLLTVLRKFAWKPILDQLQKREKGIADSISSAEQREKQAQELLTSYRARLDQIEAEARQILAKGRQEGIEAREKLLAEAREEARKISEEQRRDIERSKQEALRELYDRTAQLAAEMASQVLSRRLSPDDQRKIMTASLGEIRGRGEAN